jgi:hypothetical protein
MTQNIAVSWKSEDPLRRVGELGLSYRLTLRISLFILEWWKAKECYCKWRYGDGEMGRRVTSRR